MPIIHPVQRDQQLNGARLRQRPGSIGVNPSTRRTLMQTQEAPRKVESVTAAGNQVIETVKNLIHEGNVRRVSIKQDGRTIAEFPLTFGVVGAALAPVLAAVGAIAALVTDCTIEVQRDEDLPSGVGN